MGNSKTAVYRVKQSEIWNSVTLVTHIWGSFDLVVFEIILGSFVALICNSEVVGCGVNKIES